MGVRFHELGCEYWHSSILFSLAKCLGTPLKIDDRTLNNNFGHYARILIDIDLALPLQEQIMVERKNFCSFVSLTYERLLDFCNCCNSISHSIADYHWNNKKEGDSKPRGRSQSRTIKRHEHQVSCKASFHRQSSQGVSRTVPHTLIDHP